MAASLIPAPTTRSLARELGAIRRDLDTIRAGGRMTQLDRSSLLYPLIIRDPNTGEVLGSFGPQNGSASLIPIGGAPPPAPTAPILTPLIEGVLVEWDGTFIDPDYVAPALLSRGISRGVQPLAAPRAAPRPRGVRVYTTHVPTGKVSAAQQILDRLKAGQPIFEDWTWHGAPAVVGTWNDTLLNEAEADGLSGDNWPFSAAARDWLQEFLDVAAQEPEEPEPDPDGGTGGDTDKDGGILTPDTPEKIAAAEAVLNRFRSGKPIYEDWSFPGAPAYVLAHNDVLIQEWNRRGTPEQYLQQYLETRATRPHNFGYVGIHYGPAEDFVTDPSNMVGVLPVAGTFPISPVSEKIYVRLVAYNNSTPPVSGPASDTVGMTPDRVVATEILDGIVTEVALADLSVSTAKVQLAAVQTQLVAAAAVTGPNIAASAVGTEKLAAQSVTADQMAANSVRAGSIEAAAVTAAAIAAASVSADKILANSIGAAQLAAESVDATNIRAQAVTATKIAALAVTAGAIAANAVNAGHLTAGAVTADKLAALLVMATRMVAGDPNGSRAEINGSGIFGFAGSLQTFAVRSNGSAFLRGTIEAGTGNDRIVIQPTGPGSGIPEINFYALPTSPAYINAVPVQINGTTTDGVGIGINSGPRPSPFSGRQTTLLVRPDRAKLAYTAIGSGSSRGGELYVDANFTDMAIASSTGSYPALARLSLTAFASNLNMQAPAFVVTSDARAKTEPRALAEHDADWDPFVALKGRIGVWRYRELEPDRDHLGPVDARDFPEWMHRQAALRGPVPADRPTLPGAGNDYVSVNLADMVGVALLMADRLDDRVTALEAAARVR